MMEIGAHDMKSNIGTFLIAIAAQALASAPVLAAETATETAETSPTLSTAQRLALLFLSDDLMDRQVEVSLASATSEMFASKPELSVLIEQYPGVDKVFLDALRPVIAGEIERIVPAYRKDIADFLVTNFNAAELVELEKFYGSPTGRKLLAGVNDNIDFKEMTNEAIQSDGAEFQYSHKAMDTDLTNAARKTVNMLSRDDKLKLMRFSLSPVGRKLTRLMPQKQEIDLRWANSTNSAEMFMKAGEDAGSKILEYMDKVDAERAKSQQAPPD